MEMIGKGIIGIVIVAASCALWGYSVVCGWSWFVVPLGVAPVTFWQAFGLSSLVGITRLHLSMTIDRIHTATVDAGKSMTFGQFVSRSFGYMGANVVALAFMYLFKAWM